MDIKQARKILEKDGKNLTDEQVQEYMNTANLLTDMFFDMWNKMTPKERAKWKSKKKEKKSFTPEHDKNR